MANEIELPVRPKLYSVETGVLQNQVPGRCNTWTSYTEDENGDTVDGGEFKAYADQVEATIADLRRQLEEALNTSAGWKMCADKCNEEFALAVERDTEIKEAGFAEGIRKAAEAVKQRIGEGLSLPKSVGDKAYAKAGKHCEEAVLSLLPEPTEPSAGGAE